MILGLFAIIVGLSREGLAMIVSPKTPMFASRSRFLCKPLQIGVAPTGDITLRESELTSVWSCITREFGQPPEERKQMTAVATLTGALSHRMTVQRLQARMVKVMPE